MFDAVIFDWDETLADTRKVIVLSFQRVLRRIGCEVSDEFLEKLIGIGARNMFIEALKVSNMVYDEEYLSNLLKRKNRIHMKLSCGINLFEGAQDLLDSLHSKMKMALATMSNREVIDKILEEKSLRGYFDYIITADEVQEPKPDPEVFLKCAVTLGCPPEKCVVLEDSIFGVRAAKNANMRCIAIPSGSYSKKELKREKPDFIIDSLKDKDKILEYILS